MADLQRLLPRHYNLLRMVLAGAHTNEQMQTSLGYSPQGFRNIVNSPLFQTELARRRTELQRHETTAITNGLNMAQNLLAQTSVAAVEKMEQIMLTSSDPKIGLDAADKILKHAFGSAGPKTTASVAVILDASKVEGLRLLLKEMGYGQQSEGCPPPAADPLPDFVDVTAIEPSHV